MNETINPQETIQPQPVTNQAPPPQTTQTETIVPLLQKKKNIPAIILSIFLILALGVAGYFACIYYQPQIPGVTSIETTKPVPSSTPSPALTKTKNETKEISAITSDEGIQPQANKCYENNSYYVISLKNYPTEYGQSILIKNKDDVEGDFVCKFDNKFNSTFFSIKDYLISDGDFRSFYLDLVGDYLITDAGTGPGIRSLRIYNLKKRRGIYIFPYAGIENIGDTSITFWKPTDIEPTNENCPKIEEWKKNFGGGVISEKVSVNYETQEEVSLDEFRCSISQ